MSAQVATPYTIIDLAGQDANAPGVVAAYPPPVGCWWWDVTDIYPPADPNLMMIEIDVLEGGDPAALSVWVTTIEADDNYLMLWSDV